MAPRERPYLRADQRERPLATYTATVCCVYGTRHAYWQVVAPGPIPTGSVCSTFDGARDRGRCSRAADNLARPSGGSAAMSDDNRSPYLTVPEVAAHLRVAERTVRQMVQDGRFDAIRTGGRRGIRITRASVERLDATATERAS